MRFEEGLKIPVWYGDFAGRYSERDAVAPVNQEKAERLEKLLPSGEFETEFNKMLAAILPGEIKVTAHRDARGRTVYTAPALSRYYVVAGYMALAALEGREKLVMGTFSTEMARAFAHACKKTGFGVKLCLSAQQAGDAALVEELTALGVQLDAVSCVKMFDMPYCYINFDDAQGFGIVPVEANYGIYPQAAVSGLLAGLYGADLHAALGGEKPGCVAVAMTTGTEAVGVLPAFVGDGIPLATVEGAVAKEYHLEDSGCYTLSTRSAEEDRPNTTICPQVAHMWRSCKAWRLGADRIFPVDTAELEKLGLSRCTARAAELAFEALGTDSVLVVEERDR